MGRRHHSKRAREIERELLQKIRSEAGLSQAEVAARIGRPQSFIGKLETGERHLRVLDMRVICHACGVSPADFVREMDEMIAAEESA